MAKGEAIEHKFTYPDGTTKSFNRYAQTQEMRYMERSMRRQRALANGYKAGGQKDDYTAAKAKYYNQLAEYRRFAEEMGLHDEINRVYADGLGRI